MDERWRRDARVVINVGIIITNGGVVVYVQPTRELRLLPPEVSGG